MNKLNVQPIDNERIKVEVNDSPDGIIVSFNGDIDMEDPGSLLDPFFDEIHGKAIAGSVSIVSADFKKLNFLNSSGIKAVAKWIMKLGQSAGSYKIKLLYDKDITWQATSLQTLTFLVPGAVFVE